MHAERLAVMKVNWGILGEYWSLIHRYGFRNAVDINKKDVFGVLKNLSTTLTCHYK